MSVCINLNWVELLLRWWPEWCPYTARRLRPGATVRIGGRFYSLGAEVEPLP